MEMYNVIDLQNNLEYIGIMEKDEVIGFAFGLIKDRAEMAEQDDEWANNDLKPIVEEKEINFTFDQAKYWLEEWWEYGVEEVCR